MTRTKNSILISCWLILNFLNLPLEAQVKKEYSLSKFGPADPTNIFNQVDFLYGYSDSFGLEGLALNLKRSWNTDNARIYGEIPVLFADEASASPRWLDPNIGFDLLLGRGNGGNYQRSMLGFNITLPFSNEYSQIPVYNSLWAYQLSFGSSYHLGDNVGLFPFIKLSHKMLKNRDEETHIRVFGPWGFPQSFIRLNYTGTIGQFGTRLFFKLGQKVFVSFEPSLQYEFWISEDNPDPNEYYAVDFGDRRNSLRTEFQLQYLPKNNLGLSFFLGYQQRVVGSIPVYHDYTAQLVFSYFFKRKK